MPDPVGLVQVKSPFCSGDFPTLLRQIHLLTPRLAGTIFFRAS